MKAGVDRAPGRRPGAAQEGLDRDPQPVASGAPASAAATGVPAGRSNSAGGASCSAVSSGCRATVASSLPPRQRQLRRPGIAPRRPRGATVPRPERGPRADARMSLRPYGSRGRQRASAPSDLLSARGPVAASAGCAPESSRASLGSRGRRRRASGCSPGARLAPGPARSAVAEAAHCRGGGGRRRGCGRCAAGRRARHRRRGPARGMAWPAAQTASPRCGPALDAVWNATRAVATRGLPAAGKRRGESCSIAPAGRRPSRPWRRGGAGEHVAHARRSSGRATASPRSAIAPGDATPARRRALVAFLASPAGDYYSGLSAGPAEPGGRRAACDGPEAGALTGPALASSWYRTVRR